MPTLAERVAKLEEVVHKLDDDMNNMNGKLDHIKHSIEALVGTVGELKGQSSTMAMLLKYVIVPLIMILGGLVGIKLIIP